MRRFAPYTSRMPDHLRIAVIGHVEHITLARVPKLPAPGEIAHLDAPIVLPGGGGGIAFWQLQHGPGEVHLFHGARQRRRRG